MSEKPHIALTGRENVLAQILAEQAGAKGAFQFSYLPEADADALATFDAVIAGAGAAMGNEDGPPVFYLRQESEKTGAANEFGRPVKLAALLDAALSTARLRRIKQPRTLKKGVLFHPFLREVAGDGARILLTEKEAQFLLAILDAGDKGLARSAAMTDIWGYHPEVDSHAVDTTLYRLRQKLQEIPALEDALQNESGVYRWA